MKKGKKIRRKMLVVILPVIVIAMLILTAISVKNSKSIIDKQNNNTMKAELQANGNSIDSRLKQIESTAMSLSRVVGATYTSADLATYEKMLNSIIQDNPLILGSGIWFEPFVYDSTKEYVGPYVYKDGTSSVVTYDYSNAEYDYFNQGYYTLVSGGETKPIITDPYYDETMDAIMSSCSMPIFNEEGTFIGVVTVDIELTTIQQIAADIKVGKNGTAMLLTSNGTYLSCEDIEKVKSAMKITEDKNTSLAKASAEIINGEEGITNYKEGEETYNLYYKTLPDVGWKLIIKMPQSELNEQVNYLIIVLFIVSVIAILCAILAVYLQVSIISKGLNRVGIFARKLAEGDFTIPNMEVVTEDELGQMGNSLNEMYVSNKGIIGNISEHAKSINTSSMSLSDSSLQLQEEFKNIKSYMSEVNGAMMTASAATEELNASSEEIQSSINVLTNTTLESSHKVEEIRGRVVVIEHDSKESYGNTTKLALEYEKNLEKSIENAKVVDLISEMADVISEIADQINLLSLNASIEAARAGEAGKGFAVVASEVGKLAGDTANAVGRIHETIEKVQSAFNILTNDSKSLLAFLNTTVTPDYGKFVKVAKQYGEDAANIEDISTRVFEMSKHIEQIMQEIGQAIQGVAESTQETADNSGNVLKAVEKVSYVVDEVSEMSKNQEEIAIELKNVVSKFKVEE